MYSPDSAAIWPATPYSDARLARCILLAALLHLLLVLLIGTAPNGSAEFGEGTWGRLSVRLTGARANSGNGAKVAAESYNDPRDAALRERAAGAARDPKVPAPGAAQAPLATVSSLDAGPAASVEVAPASPLEATPSMPTLTREAAGALAPLARPTVIAADAAPRIEHAASAPPTAAAEAPTAPETPVMQRTPAAPVPIPIEAVTTVLPLPAAAVTPFARPIEPTPVAPLPTPAPTVAPLATLPVPMAVPVSVPVAAPTVAPSTVVPMAPTPRPLPAELPSVPRAEPIDSTLRRPIAPSLGTALDGSSIPAARTGAPGEQAGVPRGGAADAGARRGDGEVAPAAQPASAPRLNLELARPRMGDAALQPGRGVLQLLPPPPARKSKLAEDIENATKADCRKAHSNLGLLAVVPLAVDAVKDSGCRW